MNHDVDTIRTTKERVDGKTKIDEFCWANLPPLEQDTLKLTFLNLLNMDNKPKNLALIGASIFLACAVAIGTWIRKL